MVGGTTVAMGTTPVAIASAGMWVVVMAVLGEGGPTGLLHTRRKQPRHMPTRGTCACTCACTCANNLAWRGWLQQSPVVLGVRAPAALNGSSA